LENPIALAQFIGLLSGSNKTEMEELRKKDGLADLGRGVKSERPKKPNVRRYLPLCFFAAVECTPVLDGIRS
jgi:hypothetical protein